MAALLAASTVFANAADIQFVGVPTGVNDGHYYVMPYQISIDGVLELVTCFDVYDDVNFGDEWQANLLTVNQAALSGFFSPDTAAQAKYEEVAWLDAQTYQNTAQQIGLQYAIWNVFGTAPSTSESLQYVAEANAAASSGYQGFDFSNVRFIEQIGGVPRQEGTKQAFVYWEAPPTVRSGAASVVPEPGSGLLFIAGLVLIGGIAAFAPAFRRLLRN